MACAGLPVPSQTVAFVKEVVGVLEGGEEHAAQRASAVRTGRTRFVFMTEGSKVVRLLQNRSRISAPTDRIDMARASCKLLAEVPCLAYYEAFVCCRNPLQDGAFPSGCTGFGPTHNPGVPFT